MKKEFFEKSLEGALEKASAALNTPKEQLKYRVVEQELGSAFDRKVAVIVEFDDILSKGIPAEEDIDGIQEEMKPTNHPDYAVFLVDGIFKRMNIETNTTHRQIQDQCILTVQMDDNKLDLKKGKGRELRGAIQHLVNRAIARFGEEQSRYIVDIGGTLENRSKNMQQLSAEVAESVGKLGKTVHIHLMDSQDRRLLHLGLSDRAELSTKGNGKKQFRVMSVEPARENEKQ